MVMIVDDSVRMHTMVKRYVQKISVSSEFCECSDGAEAVDAYRQVHPGWVLMDIKMPGRDGVTATKSIRDRFPGVRVIIVSNLDDSELREAARKDMSLRRGCLSRES